MKNFMDWLESEAKGFWVVSGYLVVAAVIVVSLDYVVTAALENWGLIPSRPLPVPENYPLRYYNVLMMISTFVWAPLKEEIIHRFIPLAVVISFVSKRPVVVLGTMVVFAGLFGAIHPYGLKGKVEVAIGGLLLGLVFLKCGGLNKRFIKATVCAIVTHGLINIFIVLDELWRYYELAF